MYDRNYLYVGAMLYDNDGRSAYFFETNPDGLLGDDDARQSGQTPSVPRIVVLLARARVHYPLDDPLRGQSFVEAAIDAVADSVTARHFFEDIKYLVDEDELQTYRSLQTAEGFRSLFRAFWTKRDPLPATTVDRQRAYRPRDARNAEHSE